MDLDRLALFTVAISSGISLARALQGRGTVARGWLVVFSLLLAICGVGWLYAPTPAAIVAGVLWVLLVLAPSMGTRRLRVAMQRQDYRRARRIAQVLGVLHPADGWRQQPQLLRALELARAGEHDAAVVLLARQRGGDPAIARSAASQIFRLANRWDDLAAWLEREPEESVAADPALLTTYLRALGEVRGPEPLARVWLRFEPLLAGPQAASDDVARLFLFAFGGRRDLVERLFRGPLAEYTEDVKRFWLATADLAAGRSASAILALEALRDTGDPMVRAAVKRRLEQSLPALATTLSRESRALLDRLERRLGEEERYGDAPSKTAARPFAVWALSALLGAFFLAEIALGGSTDAATLVRLGAFVPQKILAGEWWRLALFTCLHFGPLHIGMNLFGLWVLGPFVERSLGIARFTVVYLVAAVGGGLIALALYVYGFVPPQLLVGASGGIMGMVGATAAILLRGWRVEKAGVASQRLRSIGLLVVIQAVFDLTTPQVSFTAHTAGLILGFLTTLALPARLPTAVAR